MSSRLFLLLSILPVVAKAWLLPVTPTYTTRRHDTTLSMAAGPCWTNEQGRELLERFGSIFEPEEDKKYALESLLLSPSQDRILDACRDEIKKASSSRLARRRWPVRLPSSRATKGCYGRILAEMDSGRLSVELNDGMSPANLNNGDEDEEEELMNKKRSNVLNLLIKLSTYSKGVWTLEGEMIEDSGSDDFGATYGKSLQEVSADRR
mmetsp:Transcript_541/g.692  ORF Transcript_541/g.692 Transcript_541/m.692 type:complete len:208 (+) Transcript_541:81-704(+)